MNTAIKIFRVVNYLYMPESMNDKTYSQRFFLIFCYRCIQRTLWRFEFVNKDNSFSFKKLPVVAYFKKSLDVVGDASMEVGNLH